MGGTEAGQPSQGEGQIGSKPLARDGPSVAVARPHVLWIRKDEQCGLFGDISEGPIKIILFLHDIHSNTCKTRMQIRQKHSPVNLDKQVQPSYRKTLTERTLCSSIYITNETNTRNKAGMKLLFVHVLYLSYKVNLSLSFVRRSTRIIQKSRRQTLWIYLSYVLICIQWLMH